MRAHAHTPAHFYMARKARIAFFDWVFSLVVTLLFSFPFARLQSLCRFATIIDTGLPAKGAYMKAIVSVIGTDKRGIIANVATKLWQMNINVEDISQTIMQNYFTMIMLVDLGEADLSFEEVKKALAQEGDRIGVQITIQSEAIFQAMHRI